MRPGTQEQVPRDGGGQGGGGSDWRKSGPGEGQPEAPQSGGLPVVCRPSPSVWLGALSKAEGSSVRFVLSLWGSHQMIALVASRNHIVYPHLSLRSHRLDLSFGYWAAWLAFSKLIERVSWVQTGFSPCDV